MILDQSWPLWPQFPPASHEWVASDHRSFSLSLRSFSNSVIPSVNEYMAERRGLRRSELKAAWKKESRPELSGVMMGPRSVNQCRRAGGVEGGTCWGG